MISQNCPDLSDQVWFIEKERLAGSVLCKWPAAAIGAKELNPWGWAMARHVKLLSHKHENQIS